MLNFVFGFLFALFLCLLAYQVYKWNHGSLATVVTDVKNRLHCEHGPAVVLDDNTELFYINGFPIGRDKFIAKYGNYEAF